MRETTFRLLAGLVFVSAISISTYFRRKADRDTGERVPRSVDGTTMMAMITIGGLILWLSPVVYVVHPPWMAWSSAGLPTWARWTGVAVGALCLVGLSWLFSSIGSGISPTGATRRVHALVVSGPCRWVRHPLYTVGASMFVSLGLMADNWFIAALGGLAFVGMALRTPREEANLIARFGDEYRDYMKRTGRFLPKLRR